MICILISVQGLTFRSIDTEHWLYLRLCPHTLFNVLVYQFFCIESADPVMSLCIVKSLVQSTHHSNLAVLQSLNIRCCVVVNLQYIVDTSPSPWNSHQEHILANCIQKISKG